MVHVLLDGLTALDHFFLQVLVLEIKLVDKLLHKFGVQGLDLVLVSSFVQHAHHGWQYERFKSVYSLLHAASLFFELLDLLGVVMLLECLFVLDCGLVLVEEAFCLVMHEIAENLKAISLLNRLLLEQLGDHCDPLSDLVELHFSVLDLRVVLFKRSSLLLLLQL